MTDPIVRVYESEQQAQAAVRALIARGFSEEMTFLATPVAEEEVQVADVADAQADEGEIAKPKGAKAKGAKTKTAQAKASRESSDAVIADGVKRGFIKPDQSGFYSDAMQQGASLAAVCAPFGQGVLASHILDKQGPIHTGLEHKAPTVTWDEAAPLSSAFRLPTLWRNQPAPLSVVAGAPLSRGRTFESKFAELTDTSWTLSSRVGFGLLTRNQAPKASLSGKSGDEWKSSLGFPMLASNPVPLSAAIGMELLSPRIPPQDPAPLSDFLGFPVLSHGRSFLSRLLPTLTSPGFAMFGSDPLTDNAAPFSSRIGQPVLMDDPAPLSAKMGRPTLSDNRLTSEGFGLAMLSRNAAPLSSLFHLPLLTRYQ